MNWLKKLFNKELSSKTSTTGAAKADTTSVPPLLPQPMPAPKGSRVLKSSYLIPAWDLSIEQRLKLRVQSLFYMHAVAQDRDMGEVVVRELLASDLGLKTWRTPKQCADERSIWIRHELKNKIVCINRVIQLSLTPKVSEVMIGEGPHQSRIFGIHGLETMYPILRVLKAARCFNDLEWKGIVEAYGDITSLNMEAYFSDPYLFPSGSLVAIDVLSAEDNKRGDKLMLGGYIAEHYGETIAP